MKRDGRVYGFVEHVILDYQMDPYLWLLLLIAEPLCWAFLLWIVWHFELLPIPHGAL